MGVYIKGMEMPNHCGECGIEWCERWKMLIVAGMPSAKARPKDCPLIPVPPHGRLIDETNILKVFSEEVWGFNTDFAKGMQSVLTEIRGAPTIIPAEEEP